MLQQVRATGRWLVTPSGALWSLAAVLLAVLFVGLPKVFPGVELDVSWHEALNHALAERWSAGRDFVFTHGPLGALQTTIYHPGTFTARLLWGIPYAAFTAAIFCLAAKRLPRVLPRVLFIVLLLVLPVHWSAPIVVLATTLVILHVPGSPRLLAALALAVLAVLSLVKFTFLIAAAVAAPVILGRLWRAGGWRGAAAVAGVGIAVFLGAAAAAGQALIALPAYLAFGVELTRGYNEAMVRHVGAAVDVLMALLALGAIALTLLLALSRRPIRWSVLVSSAVVAVFLFVAWKHAFVRHGGHALGFFTMAAVVPFLMWPWVMADTRRRRVVQHACLVAVVGIGVAGVAHLTSGGGVDSPWPDWVVRAYKRTARMAIALADVRGYREHLEQTRADQAAEFALPNLVRAVGSSRVGMIGQTQRILLLNGLNWAPQPVFQGYSAYTQALARLNRDYFAGERAPAFVVLDGRTIDHRLPTLDDGPALLEILRRYEPVQPERELVLLRKRSRPLPAPTTRPLSVSRVRFGEWIEIAALGAGPKSLAMGVSTSGRGKVRALLYKPSEVHLEVDFLDAGSAIYRLIPGMVREPVLIDPLPRNLAEWWGVFHGDARPRVRRVRAIADPEHVDDFAGAIGVRVLPAALP